MVDESSQRITDAFRSTITLTCPVTGEQVSVEPAPTVEDYRRRFFQFDCPRCHQVHSVELSPSGPHGEDNGTLE